MNNNSLLLGQKRIEVSLFDQKLIAIERGVAVHVFDVSSAKKGPGEQLGSYKTPRGKHYIRAKIGSNVPENGVFVGRRFTGEICSPCLMKDNPQRDWILTRILWLCGCEKGFNRFGDVDSMRRYIYIHGTPDSEPMGSPGSIGCIRMRNTDIMHLFDWVPIYCPIDVFA